jgi:hypothetical protein
MKLIKTLAILAAGSLFGITVQGQDTSKNKFEVPANATSAGAVLPKPDADGFIALFNGKDLGGWAGLDGYWSVKDGAISGYETKETSKQTFLVFTNASFSDFELRWKYRFTTPSGNSGVQFRSKVRNTKEWLVGGYQANFLTSLDRNGSIYDEDGLLGKRRDMSNLGEKTTWDAANKRDNEPLAESAKELQKIFKSKEWNDCILVAKGHHITITINGHLTTDLTDDSPKAAKDGIIAIQLHRGYLMEVQVKDIKIKILKEI